MNGVAALSFNAIARQLGMKPPSLYTYFPSKDAIYDELFRRGFIEFGNRMRSRPNINGPFANSLRSAFETYLTFAQENPDLYQIMFQRPVPGFEPSDASMAVSQSRLAEGRRQLQALIELGAVAPSCGLDEASDLVIGLMHGLTELHLANNPDLPGRPRPLWQPDRSGGAALCRRLGNRRRQKNMNVDQYLDRDHCMLFIKLV